jgi:hypothetical protein
MKSMVEARTSQMQVKAFFRLTDIFYRGVDIMSTVSCSEVEAVIGRARGRADLSKRTYLVTQGNVSVFKSWLEEVVDWNFEKFYYQVGLFSSEGLPAPEGYLLTQRSCSDGALIRHFASVSGLTLSRLAKLVADPSLNMYDLHFLKSEVVDRLSDVFPQLLEADRKLGFFELTPTMKSHVEYYKEEFGLDISHSFLIAG